MTRVEAGIVAAVVGLALIALGLDAIGWWSRFVDADWPQISTVAIRVLRTMVAAGLPFAVPGSWRIRVALVGCALADVLLVGVHWPIGGIGAFAAVQAIPRVALARPLWERSDRKWAVGAVAAVLGLAIAGVMVAFGGKLVAKGLLVPILGYSTLLASMVTAALSGVILAPPTRTTALFAVGAIAFVGCDVSVGVGAIYGETAWGAAVQVLTGVPWTIALLTLALSGAIRANPGV